MKSKEFNLSEKKWEIYSINPNHHQFAYNEEDVKEFIRWCEYNSEIVCIAGERDRIMIDIEKLREGAGKELVEEKKNYSVWCGGLNCGTCKECLEESK